MRWFGPVFMVLASISSLAFSAAASGQPAQPPGCTASEYRAFDFLIGHWRVVHTATGKLMGQNLVEWTDLGCAVKESLTFPGQGVGSSINFYAATDGRWHGTYHDSIGLFAIFEGTVENGRHIVSGNVRFPQEPARLRKVRQTSFRGPDGRPRQIGERWDEAKNSWEQIYDVTFCPLQKTESAPCA